MARVRGDFQLLEKMFALAFGKAAQNFGLQVKGDEAGGPVGFASLGSKPNAMRPAIRFMRSALDQSICFHAFQQRRDRVWIARDELGNLTLGDSFWVGLNQGAQDGELIRSDFQMCHAAAESLVEPVPGAP